jgi:hypothetical protein
LTRDVIIRQRGGSRRPEIMLTMLLRLKDLRRTIVEGCHLAKAKPR